MADEVEREITVPVPPDEAWTLVTDAEELQRWLAPEVEIDLRDGGEVRIVGDDGSERRGTVELVEAPRRLRFAWTAPDGDPSIVEISVDPEEDGSRIRVSERPVVEPVAAIGVVLEFPVSRTRGPLALAA